MPSVAEVVDVLVMGKSSEVLAVPSPIRLDSDEVGLDSTSGAAPHTIYPPFTVIPVIVVQPFGAIVFPNPVAVLVGRLSARRRGVPHPGLLQMLLWAFSDGGRDLGTTEIYKSRGKIPENAWARVLLPFIYCFP
jgi:hypothetical protein